MAALNRRLFAQAGRTWLARLTWELRRFVVKGRRRFGSLMFLVPASLVTATVSALFTSVQQGARDVPREPAKSVRMAVAVSPSAAAMSESRSRIREFESLLPPHDETPQTVADVLGLASRTGVVIKRAEYKSVVDSSGGFVRYQMALPVIGEPAAVVRFLHQAMLEHRTLTIESVRFSRPQADSREVEARVQWSLLTRLPRANGVPPSDTRVATEPPVARGP